MLAQFSDIDILRKFGIKVPKNQVIETMNMLLSDPDTAKQIQQIKSSIKTMINQDDFIQWVSNSHKNISDIPENSKVIQFRDNTFSIRAINPENIKSLTERAFFNSFNLDRNVLNDLQEQIKLHKNNSYRPKQGKQNNCNQTNQTKVRAQNQQQQKCICSKNIPGSEWIQCSNQQKCRGSNWYHLQCSGLDRKDMQNIQQIHFTCQLCKRQEIDEQSQSEPRKRNKEDESGK